MAGERGAIRFHHACLEGLVKTRSVGQILAQRAPLVYRFVRPPWLLLKRFLGIADYWERRRHLVYYQEVLRLAKKYVPRGDSALDVGANKADLLSELDWFHRRVALDLMYPPRRRGIERIMMDFMEYRPDITFDLVLCLQTLEHIEDPAPFARKLLKTGETVIISVPYKWPRGHYEPHVQDPVDEAKLLAWTGRQPDETRVVSNGKERLIAVYSCVT